MAVRHLIVKLTANTDAMSTGLRKGQQEVSSFSQGINSLGSIVTKVGAAMGVAFGAEALREMFMSRVEAIDALGDAADRLNIDPQILAGLGHGADMTGSSTETLTASIERMNRTIGEAKMMGGQAGEVFQRLGLDVDSLTRMGADEAFYSIADAISGLPTPGEQAAAAFRVMGRQGAELVPLLRKGSGGLREFQEEAERLGIAIDAIEVKRIGDLMDEIDRAKKGLQGAGNDIVTTLATPVERGSDWISGLAQEFRAAWAFGGAGVDWIMGDVEGWEAGFAEADRLMTSAAAEFEDLDDVMNDASQQYKKNMEGAAEAVEQAAAAQEKALASFGSQVEALDKQLATAPGRDAGDIRGELLGELNTLSGLNVSVPDSLRSSVEMLGLSDSQERLQEFAESIQLAIPPALTLEEALEFPDERLQAAASFVSALERGAQASEAMAAAQEAADEAIADAVSQSEEWARQAYQVQLGLTDREMQIEDARRKGVGEDELDQMKLASKMIDRAELIAESRKLEEQFASPEIQMQEFADRLSQMISEGLSPEAAQAAFRAKLDDMNVREREVDAPELKRAGSQEAYSAILKYRESQEAKTPEWAIKMNEWLEKIAAATAQEAEQAPAKAENLF